MSADTVAVLLGAHEFPDTTFRSTKAFTRSAKLVKTYLTQSNGLGLPKANVLNLFDSQSPAAKQLDRFEAFLAGFAGSNELPRIRRLILYYVGHGTFPGNEYCLAVRRSKQAALARSSIRFHDLAHSIVTHAKWLQTYLILDACFAGKGARYFMAGALDVVKKEVDSSFLMAGVTLYCSSPSDEPSYYLPNDSATAFTKAVMRALQRGIAGGPQYLSLEDIEPLAWEELQAVAAEAQEHDPSFVAIQPEIHTPRRRSTPIARQPLFPNPGYRNTPQVVEDSQESDYSAAYLNFAFMRAENRILMYISTLPNAASFQEVISDRNGNERTYEMFHFVDERHLENLWHYFKLKITIDDDTKRLGLTLLEVKTLGQWFKPRGLNDYVATDKPVSAFATFLEGCINQDSGNLDLAFIRAENRILKYILTLPNAASFQEVIPDRIGNERTYQLFHLEDNKLLENRWYYFKLKITIDDDTKRLRLTLVEVKTLEQMFKPRGLNDYVATDKPVSQFITFLEGCINKE